MTDLNYAIRTGAWLVNNQVREVQHVNPCSMDVGRFPINMHIQEHKIVDGFLSTNWFTGMSIYALLMLRDLNGEPRWLESAELAGNYLRCLQITMDPNPELQGAIYEYAPYAKMSLVRDSLSAAWGLLRLYRATENVEYLNRVELFAHWHMNYGMQNGYPIAIHNMGTGPNATWLGGFQAGSANFYLDLYEVTGKEIYLDAGRGILDFFITHFWDNKTGIRIQVDPATGYQGDDPDPGNKDWNEMHKFNDDFNSVALMLYWTKTGERRYLDFVDTYMTWCLSMQHEDGSFGNLRLEESSCVAALNLLNAGLILDNQEYFAAAQRARTHLLASYQQDPECSAVDGGVLGLQHCVRPVEPNMISLRVTNYTVYTMTLFGLIETQREGGLIPEPLCMNPMFPGLRQRPV